MLSVPEEYAGQLMQCPLCRGTFQMPAAPQPAAGSTMPAPPPPPRPSPPAPDPFHIPTPPSGVYQAASEPKTTPLPPTYGGGMPPGPPPMDYATVEPLEDVAPPPSAPGGYRHAIPLRFNPRYLQWIIPISLILVFVLLFFTWVGIFPGNVGIVTQNGWQAAFNSYSIDKDLGEPPPGTADEKGPGINLLMIFYVILLCITLLLAIGALVLGFLAASPSSGFHTLRKWRWLIVGGVATLAFLFLLIQLLVGFSLEKKAWEGVEKKLEAKKASSEAEIKKSQMEHGLARSLLGIGRTTWLRLAFFFQFLAVICCFLAFWVGRRGNRPLPKLEFAW
jgi:hypothetical protein